MSKARDYVAHVCQLTWLDREGNAVASVNSEEDMGVDKERPNVPVLSLNSATLSEKEALSFAKWIIDTYGDKKK